MKKKKGTRSNFRVEVEPRNLMAQTEEEWERDCEAIAEQIRRHVDGLPFGHDRGVSVMWDTEFVCEHCGNRWTEDSDTYNGGCCDEDEENNPEPEPDDT